MNTDNKLEHAHHFKDRDHEYESSKQGVWLFMVTEVLMFGGLLVAYFIFHALYPQMFVEGSKFLDWRLGAVNTVVLLTSSLTMALGIYYIRINERQKAITNLVITLICGAIFMAIKYYEYSHKFHLGLFPGQYFNPQGVEVQSANLALYFSSGVAGLNYACKTAAVDCAQFTILPEKIDLDPNFIATGIKTPGAKEKIEKANAALKELAASGKIKEIMEQKY